MTFKYLQDLLCDVVVTLLLSFCVVAMIFVIAKVAREAWEAIVGAK